MMVEAEESLQYMVERILLTIFGYPIKDSDVSESRLRQDPYRLNWKNDEQIEFSSYIDNM